MNRKLLAIFATWALLLATFGAYHSYSQAVNQGSPTYLAGVDPCGGNGIVKKSVAIAITTATTTNIVALSGTTVTYVCGWSLSLTGTNPTWQLEYGTGATCGTGTTTLTGPYEADITAAIGQYIYGGGEMALTQTAAANGLCVVTGGTTPHLNGILTYVQQ